MNTVKLCPKCGKPMILSADGKIWECKPCNVASFAKNAPAALGM